jgi:hypothetical protein
MTSSSSSRNLALSRAGSARKIAFISSFIPCGAYTLLTPSILPYKCFCATHSYSPYSHLQVLRPVGTTAPMKGFLTVIRWVLVLPGAFGALILLDLLFNLIPIDLGIPLAFDLAKGSFIGMGFIMAGLFIAPLRRPWVARILSILCLIFCLLVVAGTLVGGNEHASGVLTRQCAATLISLVAAFNPQSVIDAVEKK